MSVIDNVKEYVTNNSPAILTGLGVAGIVSTAYLSARSGYQHGFKDAKRNDDYLEDTTMAEKIKLSWTFYIPPAIVVTLATASVIASHGIHTRRNAALVGLYSVTERAFAEYKEKVLSTVGKSKEQTIRDEVTKDALDANPVTKSEVFITGAGDVLCFDRYTSRYFESSQEKIRKAQNDVNSKALNEMYASHNDFYREVGLPITGLGEEVGWRSDHLLDIDFSSHLADDGRPCLAIDYRMSPIRGYYKFNE